MTDQGKNRITDGEILYKVNGSGQEYGWLVILSSRKGF